MTFRKRPEDLAAFGVTPRAPVGTWTDEEWLASMAEFPPNTPISDCERWVAQRRKDNQDERKSE
jgi:hypothetical protein